MNISILFALWFGLVGGLGLGDTPVSDSPETVRAQYEQAAAHLDAGGDFYAVNVDLSGRQSMGIRTHIYRL